MSSLIKNPVYCVIGAGNLGMYHAESIYHRFSSGTLYIIDKNLSVAARVAQTFPIIDGSIRTIFYTSIENLPPYIDVVIIATNADVRLKLFEGVVNHSTVRYFVLEKIAFQSIEQLEHASALIQQHHLKVWVNCPRRMTSIYYSIREKIGGCGSLDIHVSGSNWGLGCNALHFIDFVAWLTKSQLQSIDVQLLDDVVHQARRPGFVEFTGTMTTSYSDGSKLTLVSFDSERVIDLKTEFTVNGKVWSVVNRNGKVALLLNNKVVISIK